MPLQAPLDLLLDTCLMYSSLIVTLCACELLTVSGQRCETPWDCSLNGECVAWRCACDPAWTGPTCAQLDLLPMTRHTVRQGAYHRSSGETSWGGIPLLGEDGKYHLFVAEMKNNCTLQAWIPNSQISHAVADVPQGPYVYKDTVFETFHHNPTVRKLGDGTYLMFMIGGPMHGTANCTSRSGTDQGEQLDSSILVSSAPSLNGPWSEPSGPLLARGSINDWDYVVTNPAPLILPNGTILLYYRGTPHYWANDLPESIGLAMATHWKGPYTKVFKKPVLSVMNEDPFVWRDDRGFHMLTHGRDDWWNIHVSYSYDGLSWSSGASVAADPNITLTDGTTYSFVNRERPQMFFNETTGSPALLFTGVCPDHKYGYAYTLAQFVNQRNKHERKVVMI